MIQCGAFIRVIPLVSTLNRISVLSSVNAHLYPSVGRTVVKQSTRLTHISAFRLALQPGYGFRRSWNPLRNFGPLSFPSSSQANADQTKSAAANTATHVKFTSDEADVTLLKSLNENKKYAQVIAHFDSLRPISTSIPRSLLINAMDPRLVIEYVKALLATNQLYKLNEGSSPISKSSPPSPVIPPEFKLKLDQSGSPLNVTVKEVQKGSWLRDIIKYALTVTLFLSALSLIVEGAAQNLPKGLGLGNKKVNVVTHTNTTFKDVKGCDEVKEELQEIISYLTDPEKFTRLGAKLPKGVLLSGPPGTGKTLLARAVAGEAKVPFIQASGSEFEEMFVGVGARRIRDLFASARKMAPSIVFIDEIDAVGSKRVNKENTSVRMTLNQLLVELDGFEQNEGVVVICATNFPESLDSALIRPGRLDKTVVVPLPDLQGRQEILDHYGTRVVLSDDVDLSILARRTAGMTGADLFNVINIAAVKSSAEGKSGITMDALESAFDRVVVGLERRNPMSEEERIVTAYHEGGHALVSVHTKGADPVHKATIMPRGSALGVTWQIPEADRYQQKLYELQARLDVLMGGKAAEKIKYGEENVTAGCSSDLKTATSLARQMVMHFGMGVQDTAVPMFIDLDSYGALSGDLRKKVDDAVQNLLNVSFPIFNVDAIYQTAFERAFDLLSKHREQLDAISMALIEYEVLSGEEIKLVISGKASEISILRAAAKRETEKRRKVNSISSTLLKKYTEKSSPMSPQLPTNK